MNWLIDNKMKKHKNTIKKKGKGKKEKKWKIKEWKI